MDNTKLPVWAYKAYCDYVINGLIIRKLTEMYNKSEKTTGTYINLMIEQNKHLRLS
ncbi:hypothetical protein FACS1894152_6080 [Bacilli bacterium]|nr:hypothetical protein FACS1894152_6080 [Bacilli bacterium]